MRPIPTAALLGLALSLGTQASATPPPPPATTDEADDSVTEEEEEEEGTADPQNQRRKPRDEDCRHIEREGIFDSLYGPEFTVCIDGTAGVTAFAVPLERQYLHPLPHQRVRVRVFLQQDADATIGVEASGQVAATVPGVRGVVNETALSNEPRSTSLPGERGTGLPFSDFLLGPFGEGPVEITITRTTPKPGQVDDAVDEIATALTQAIARLDPAHQEAMPRAASAALLELKRAVEAVDAAPASWKELTAKIASSGVTVTLAGIAAPPAATGDADADAKAREAARDAAKKAMDAVASTLGDLAEEVPKLSKEPEKTKIPLVVDKTYTGSLNMGLAVVTAGAAGGQYTVDNSAGRPTAIIDGAGSAPIDLDLVIGYNQLLHRRPATSTRPHTGVTFGVTATSLSGGDLEPLKGAYAGVSWGSRNLTTALVVSARSVTRLRDQYDRGDAVDPATKAEDLVAHPIGVGLGLVFYAPELLKIGQNGGNG